MTSTAIALIVLSLIIFLASRRHVRRLQLERSKLGINGELIYFDQESMKDVLTSHQYGIIGTPDYVVKTSDGYMPIEMKTRYLNNGKAHEGEVLQLIAYCILVEENFKSTVRQGRITYADCSIDIPMSQALIDKLLKTLSLMQSLETSDCVHRSHESVARCSACTYRNECTESLVDAKSKIY